MTKDKKTVKNNSNSNKKSPKMDKMVSELTLDIQRLRADFENYRKRSEKEKEISKEIGKVSMIMQLLPVIDNIDRALSNTPKGLLDNAWVQGIMNLSKSLDKSLNDMDLHKIEAKAGDVFNPDIHDAIQFDEEADGDTEVIESQLQPGYKFGDQIIRHALVKVTKK